MAYLKSYGEWRGNANAQASNFLKLTDVCDCTPGDVCQDFHSSTRADTITITGAVVTGADGVAVTTTFAAPILVGSSQAIEDAVQALLNGEVNPMVRATYVGTTFTFTHWGASTVVLQIAGASIANTRTCNIAVSCSYSLQVVGTILAIGFDGSTQAMANNPYNFSGTPATDATKAALIDTDLTAALATLGATVTSVTVTPNTTDEAFDVVVVANAPFELTSGTELFVQSDCAQAWVA